MPSEMAMLSCFGCVSRLHPLLPIFEAAHYIHIFRNSTVQPRRFTALRKVCTANTRSIYFLAPCVGCATWWRLTSVTQDTECCFLGARASLISIPRKTSHACAKQCILYFFCLGPGNRMARRLPLIEMPKSGRTWAKRKSHCDRSTWCRLLYLVRMWKFLISQNPFFSLGFGWIQRWACT